DPGRGSGSPRRDCVPVCLFTDALVMFRSVFHSKFSLFAGVVMSLLAVGCGSGERDEEYAAIQGAVKHEGKAVPSGAKLVLEDKTRGVRMTFPIGADGKYEVPETANLPAGTYNVGVTPPPSDAGVSEANYDDAMSNPTAQPKDSAKDDFP